MPLTRNDKRARALIVTPRGTQRILRPQQSHRNPAAAFAGGSRPSFSIGKGSGMARGEGGGGISGANGIGAQASIAAALAGGAFPSAEAPPVFAPQPVTPYAEPTLPQPGSGTQQVTDPANPDYGVVFNEGLPTYRSSDELAAERERQLRLARLAMLG